MLTHLSKRFSQTEQQRTHEPRAALFLNRFTRTLTIMYATAGVEKILGISGEDMKGKSFYYCIQENCLDEAVRCLESAKANDSIAYLRFWFRDPRIDDPPSQTDADLATGTDTDASMTDVTSEMSDSEWDEGQGSRTSRSSEPVVHRLHDEEQNPTTIHNPGSVLESAVASTPVSVQPRHPVTTEASNASDSRTSSGADSIPADETTRAIFGHRSSGTSRASEDTTPLTSPESPASSMRYNGDFNIELEAVISCTSDGLVVCLRRARPTVPANLHQPPVHQPTHKSGVFAAPWATDPVFHPARPDYHFSSMHGYGTAGHHAVPSTWPVAANGFVPPPQGPSAQALFDSIRDTAIFAWALTSINGSLADCATNPSAAAGESQPPDGLPVWQPSDKAHTNGYTDHQESNAVSKPYEDHSSAAYIKDCNPTHALASNSMSHANGTGYSVINSEAHNHVHDNGNMFATPSNINAYTPTTSGNESHGR